VNAVAALRIAPDTQPIELPWPPSKLSPNGSRGSYFAHAAAARKYRGECLLELKVQSVRPLPSFWEGPVMIELEFCSPTKRQCDLDNLLARTKHGIDALAEVLGVDDKRFEYTLRRGEPVKHGRVMVSVG
jgi:crossover junction endodeoxyribonuclease RusA